LGAQRAGTWIERWRGERLHAPTRGYSNRRCTEPAALVHAVIEGPALSSTPAGGDVPRLVLAMDGDELTPVATARAFAAHSGAQFQVIGGAGHAVLADTHWEACVAAVHRWVIRELGVDLLALYDEAWEGREKP
jgi:pimeloyl-ACP methyl ester carboxylesterase